MESPKKTDFNVKIITIIIVTLILIIFITLMWNFGKSIGDSVGELIYNLRH